VLLSRHVISPKPEYIYTSTQIQRLAVEGFSPVRQDRFSRNVVIVCLQSMQFARLAAVAVPGGPERANLVAMQQQTRSINMQYSIEMKQYM